MSFAIHYLHVVDHGVDFISELVGVSCCAVECCVHKSCLLSLYLAVYRIVVILIF